jgi:hypothetical protein
MEEWKQVIDYPNYSISNLGNVRNDKTGRILKSFLHNGYFSIDLMENCKTNQKTIHRLVAIQYIENPNNYLEVDHIDRNKLNNNLSNLRWCSRNQNQQNKKKTLNCSSIYRGVTFNKSRNRWCAGKRINGKTNNLGSYKTEIEAAQAYNQFIIDNNLGEFCELNVL